MRLSAEKHIGLQLAGRDLIEGLSLHSITERISMEAMKPCRATRPAGLFLLVLTAALAGCASRPDPGIAAFETAIALPVSAEAILREGERIRYHVPAKQNAPLSAYFDTACGQSQAASRGAMIYSKQGAGQAAFTDGRSDQLPLEQRERLRTSAQLQEACRLSPPQDWRLIEEDSQGRLSIDINSIQRDGQQVTAWGRREYSRYKLGPNNVQLIAEQRQRLTFDCTRDQVARSASVDVDAFDDVSNWKIFNTPESLKLDTPNDAEKRLRAAACKDRAQLNALATAGKREPLPPQLDTPQTTPDVLASIASLNRPAPSRKLESVTYSYDADAMGRTIVRGASRRDILERDGAGLITVQSLDQMFAVQKRLTFMGLIDLDSTAIDSKTGAQKAQADVQLKGLHFSGDWNHLQPGSEIAYTRVYRSLADPAKPEWKRITTCRIGAATSASAVHAALQGRAVAVRCADPQLAKVNASDEFWYLDDYGVAIKRQEKQVISEFTYRVQSTR